MLNNYPFKRFLFFFILFSLPLGKGWKGVSAQNTFRYKVCPEVKPLPRWNTWSYKTIHQINSDSGYIAFSTTSRELASSGIPDDSLGWDCFSATKMDKYGNLQWIKNYQEVSNLTHKSPNNGIATADSGFVMAGQKTTKGNPYYTGRNTYVQKMDKKGTIKWAKQYKINGDNDNHALKIMEMPDAGYIVMGETKDPEYSDNFHDSYNIYLLRLDKNGNKVWCYYYDAKQNGEEHPNSLALTADGGFIIGGRTYVDNYWGLVVNTKIFGYKAMMMKISSNGKTIEWARRYGEVFRGPWPQYRVMSSDLFYDTQPTPDGGYISVGETLAPEGYDDVSNKGWVVKTNGLGVIEWQKTYDTWGMKRVEVLNDGYVIASSGGFTKITKTGVVEWSKLYDTDITDVNLTMDNGFVISSQASILKTNSLGEFENGCVYNSHLSVWLDARVDTAYALSSRNVNTSPSNLNLQETTLLNRQNCPIVCGIGDNPVAPKMIAASNACVNTDARVTLTSAYYGGDPNVHYSYYKVNFGDPNSGSKNETTGSGYLTSYAYHNYASAGTYTVTLTVYNNDYSESATVSTTVTIIPQAKQIVVTPQIHVCTKDTVTIIAQIHNYSKGLFVGWNQESYYNNGNPTILSQTDILKDGVLTSSIVVATDTAEHYYILYSSFGSCEMHDTIKVVRGDNEALITGNTKICAGGKALLTANGGDSYLWNSGATTKTITVNPTANKTYWLEAKTNDGCRDTGYVYISVVNTIDVTLTADRTSVCTGDTLILKAQGASNYSWNMGATTETIKPVMAKGQNTFMITGTSGLCTDTASIVITADDQPIGVISGPSSACYGVEYTLTASGGDRYNWIYSNDNSNPTQVFQLSSSAYNNAVLIYNGGCSTSVDYNVSSNGSPSIGGITADECRVCPGTTVTLRKYFYPLPWYYTDQNQADNKENQGLTYQWSTGATGSGTNDSIKINVTRDTLITLTTKNVYDCSVTHSAMIYATPHFSIKKQAASIPSCSNSPTTLYVMGDPLFDMDYTWSTGSKNDTIVVSPLQDTMYYVTALVNGCTKTDSVWVKAKSNLPKAIIHGDSIVCKGTSGVYNASGNIAAQSIKWLTGNVADTLSALTLSFTHDTILKAIVTFAGGCGDTAEFNISVIEPQALITGNTIICSGGTVSLLASGGYTYQWSTGSSANNITITTGTNLPIALIAFAGNCSDTAMVSINTNKSIIATLQADEDSICNGTPLTLIANGGTNYVWNTGEKGERISISPSITTTYTVNVTAEENCFDTKSITINVTSSPSLSIGGLTSICSGKTITLSATGASNYLWTTGATTTIIIVSPINDSSYSVSTSIGDCETSYIHYINVVASTSISAGADQTILSGEEVTLTPNGGNSYNWFTLDGAICSNCNNISVNPTKTTTYYVNETGSQCSEDSVTIYVLDCSELIVPNAFSPNGDEINDVLYVQNDCIKDLDFKIYDRWGNIVFKTTDIKNGWDGSTSLTTGSKKVMDAAVFVYYISATVFSGDVIVKKGNVTLMR